MQGAMTLHVAYIGIVNGLFDALHAQPGLNAEALAAATTTDAGYVLRWCDAAYAFELLERDEANAFSLTEMGAQFRPEAKGTFMPAAVQTVLGAHMAERAAGLMRTGERPGESVLAERETVLPWFGPMLERAFGPVFENEIIDAVPAFKTVNEDGGLVVDLGCGNGWYLRALARRCDQVRGIGLDGFDENIAQANTMATDQGNGDRLVFQQGDLHNFTVDEPVSLIAMNRALHHVWDDKDNVFRIIAEHLAPGGSTVIWEPRWPDSPSTLREPRARGMAFQNLSEHVQGNHFLRPDEIADEMTKVGLQPETYLFAEGNEAVIVGTKV